MRSVAEFLADCVAMSQPLPPLDVALDGAAGCILAADVPARGDLPARTVADGDGYAVRAEDVAQAAPDAPVELAVADSVLVTALSGGVLVPGACVRVASGAPLPVGADAVVPLADTDHGSARVVIKASVAAGDNVRQAGEDVTAGDVLLTQGTRLGSRQIAVLAAEGYATANVHPAPRVVIMAIGDELQDPGRGERAGAVFDGISHALASAVREAGGNVFRVGVVSDDKTILRETLEDQLVRADIIITTGGLSYGGGDTVKEVLASFGSVRFDAVSIWPGRQFGVGTIHDEATVFCLPGNPVAALTAYEVFIRPALRTMAGFKHVHRPLLAVRLAQSWQSDAQLQEFVPVRVLGNPSDGYDAEVLVTPGVTSLRAFSRANGLMVVPVGQEHVAAGELVNCVIIDR